MDDLELAVAAARAGGEIVAAGFGAHTTTEYKGRNDPVTEVDRASEAAILAVLSAERRDDAVVGEEGTSRSGSERMWLVDPLDGTVNFVHGLAQVSVSVALYEGDRALAGVVLDPIHDELFAAAAGRGATRNDAPMAVSATADLGTALLVTGFPYDHHEHAGAYVATLEAMLRRVNGVRRLGSAALDLCYVAAGRLDAYWEYELKPWDIAAGVLIVEEAGGRVTDPFGAPTTPQTRHLVASNGPLHEEVRELVAATFPEHLR
jgi:myo-inositol-1(or 4)-monophosphatase